MGLFDMLGDMARDKIDAFKEDPAGNIERTVTSSINKFNESYEKKRNDVIKYGERKARNYSDAELEAYSRKADRDGNDIAQEIAQRERERRGL